MEKLTDLRESPRAWPNRVRSVLSLFVFAFLAAGFYSYKPGKVSLLNELTGCVLLLSWSLVWFSVLREPRQRSSPTQATAGEIRENPWEATKSFAMVILLAVFCGGAIYAGAIAFWTDKVLYWPGGRGRSPLYVFWADSSMLAFATAVTWILIGLMGCFGVVNAYLVTDDLPKWREILFKK